MPTRFPRAVSLLTLSLALGATPALSQISPTPQSGAAAPQITTESMMRSRAQAQLTEALRRIGRNGVDANALIDAGNAAVIMEDGRAALNFFARADAISPNNPRVKAGLGAAYLLTEQPALARQMFDQAVRLGVQERTVAADLGLAYDLSGDQRNAQRLYALAMQSGQTDKLLRRYALSLGISGDVDRAVQYLTPLLQRRDRAAWRDRAFILAMNGRSAEALDITNRTLPANVAQGLQPYLLKMNRLSNQQMALAVHYGQFPQNDAELARVGRSPRGSTAVASSRPQRTVSVQQAAGEREPRFVDENGRPVRLSRSERDRYLKEWREKQAQEAAEAARQQQAQMAAAQQAERQRQAQIAAQQQQEAQRRVESERQAAIQRQQAEARAQQQAAQQREAEQRRLAAVAAQQQAAREAAARAAAAPAPAQTAPIQTAAIQGPPAGIQPVTLPPSASAARTEAREVASAASAMANPSTAAAGASLADLVKAVDHDPEPVALGIDLATLEQIRTTKLKEAQERERAEAREEAKRAAAEKAKAEADRKAKAAADKKKAEAAEAKKKAQEEADRKKANPSRSWAQIASGSNTGALGFDYRKAAKGKGAELFKGKSGFTADNGRLKRLLVGPFTSGKDAAAWIAKYKKAGGDAFVFTSEAGEEVAKIGG